MIEVKLIGTKGGVILKCIFISSYKIASFEFFKLYRFPHIHTLSEFISHNLDWIITGVFWSQQNIRHTEFFLFVCHIVWNSWASSTCVCATEASRDWKSRRGLSSDHWHCTTICPVRRNPKRGPWWILLGQAAQERKSWAASLMSKSNN